MHSLTTILVSICLIYTILGITVSALDLQDVQANNDELIALTRDHFGRADPDALLNGFFPVWATIQFLIACFFLIVAIVSTIGYLLGWRTPAELRNQQKK